MLPYSLTRVVCIYGNFKLAARTEAGKRRWVCWLPGFTFDEFSQRFHTQLAELMAKEHYTFEQPECDAVNHIYSGEDVRARDEKLRADAWPEAEPCREPEAESQA